MTHCHNYLLICTSSIALLVFNSCTSTSNAQKFKMSFLPPAPKSVPALTPLSAAPPVASNLYLAETPGFLNQPLNFPPRPSQADLRIRRADDHFQSGKKLFQDGDMDGARKEFDQSVDILMSAPENFPERHKVEKRLEELVASIHRYDVNSLGAGDLSNQPGYDKAPLEDILDLTFPVDPNLKPKVKEQVVATTSQLPLEVNDAVLSYIHYFSSDRGRKTLIAGLKRAGKYKPLISRILSEEGVPQELIYLAQAESGFLPRAVSNKAATGMWQFVQWRGREYGLNQTSYSDDRLDPEKATRSAARHLRDLYQKFGDWYLAIAGYNCGPGGVEKAVQRTGYADFWQLRSRNALPKETTNYVPIILAMTIMSKNAKDYDLENIDTDSPLEYETVPMAAPTHLALVADVADRPVSDIRELNPALLGNVAPANYSLRVPKGTLGEVVAGLDNVPELRRASWRVHRVGQGETIASIAAHYNMPVSTLAAANTSSTSLELGNVVVIPAAAQQEARQRLSARGKKTSTRKMAYSHTKTVAKPSLRRASATRKPAAKPTRRAAGNTVEVAGLN
jgi:membrane-bound lytic murein transglycosylase D